MIPPRPTELAWMLLRGAIHEGDIVIDATAGNGHDTAFLAECAGPGGKVIAFDIQAEAIGSAMDRIANRGLSDRVDFHASSHAMMSEHAAAETVAVIMFNLGYFPGGDHGIATRTPETIEAISQAMNLLKPGGILSIICYPGHDEGAAEATAVEETLVTRASRGWKLAKYSLPGTLSPAPFLLLARKP